MLLTAYAVSTTASDAGDEPTIGYVNAYRLNVRGCPTTECPIIASVARNQALPLLGRTADNHWLKVEISSVCKGWVYARYVHTYSSMDTLPIID